MNISNSWNKRVSFKLRYNLAFSLFFWDLRLSNTKNFEITIYGKLKLIDVLEGWVDGVGGRGGFKPKHSAMRTHGYFPEKLILQFNA